MSTDSPQHSWNGTSSDNLTSLTQLTENTLLAALKQRYQDSHIYTDVGDILVAVNPFRTIPIYTESWSHAYSRPDVNSLAPHIFKVASRAYNAMLSEKKDQVCVISGESGAGKTESAKFIMSQVMAMCRSAGLGLKLQHKVTQLNPILEAFGNAKTALNDNSSRFGKYVQLVFDSSGRIVGAGLEQYLLEKSRVCVQGGKERNFHIFYYLYAGLSSNQKEEFGLKEPSKHRYLKSYPDVITDCQSNTSREMHRLVRDSMEAIGFSEEEVHSLFTILAGVILLGDIEFKGDDNAELSNRDAAEAVAKILQLESCDDLCFALTKLRTETRGEVVDKCYSVTKAADVRDGLAKALYARMFQWIVSRLNGYLQPYPENDQVTMGILDIFGFENFEQNSFEQFCINLANEQLQCYFNHQIFAMEKMELAKEGLDELDITYKDNKPVLDLFLTKPIGLLSLLDDQCRGLNGSEKAFIHKCKESFGKHSNFVPHRGNALVFTVKHYAGDVQYQAEGFQEKNKDSLPDSVVGAVKFSSVRLIRTLFVRRSEHSAGGQLRKSILYKSQKSVMRAMSRRRKSSHHVRKGGKRKLLTVSAHFRQSLDDLMERLFAATPHFVRCLKPNVDKKPNKWVEEFMLKQLQYTGMLEAVRVRREGFAYRPFFSSFFNMYRPLAYHFTDTSHKGCEVACREILAKAGLENWRMGTSRVFLRYYHQEKLQLLLKDIESRATLIQKIYRGYHTRKQTKELRERQKREKEIVSSFLSAMNKQCDECFPVIVELNRTDNLLSHERFAQFREAAAPIARVDSYAGLDAQGKNLKRAKKLGIKMMPSLKLPSPTPIERTSSDEIVSLVSSGSESEGEEIDVPVSPVLLRSPSTGNQTPVPRPRSRLPSQNRLSSESEFHFQHRSDSMQVPVPKPRSRMSSPNPEGRLSQTRTDSALINAGSVDARKSGDHSSPKPTPRRRSPKQVNSSYSTLSTGMAEGLFEYKQDASEVPHYQLPVGGRKESADDFSLINSSALSLDGDPPHSSPPVPKPRTSSSPSPYHIPRSPSRQAELRAPLMSRDSKEISLDFLPTASNLLFERKGSDDVGESVLDFVPNGRSRSHMISDGSHMTSKDLSAKEQGTLRQDSNLTTEELYATLPSMASNLIRLRHLANSVGSMLDEESGTRRYSGMSTGSDNNSVDSPDHPPQADKRAKKGRDRFRRRANSKGSNRGSISSMGGSVRDLRLGSVSSDGGESSDFLGFYPNLNQSAAEDFVLGQSRGTFAICRESSLSENLSHSHILVLSLGRSVFSVPIVTTSSLSGDQFHLETVTDPTFPLLKELVDHYRTHAVVEGVCLLQPRLLAGVYVVTPPTLQKPPVTPRKRLPVPRKRRKICKPTLIESVA